jgi:hypothetical protein
MGELQLRIEVPPLGIAQGGLCLLAFGKVEHEGNTAGVRRDGG